MIWLLTLRNKQDRLHSRQICWSSEILRFTVIDEALKYTVFHMLSNFLIGRGVAGCCAALQRPQWGKTHVHQRERKGARRCDLLEICSMKWVSQVSESFFSEHLSTDGWIEGCWGGAGQKKSASVTSTCYCWWPVPPLQPYKTDLSRLFRVERAALSSSIYTILTQVSAFSQ